MARLTFDWKTFLKGLIVLILVPLLVLLAFAAYVYLMNGRPQLGLLRARVEPQVVFPWDDAAYYITFEGKQMDTLRVPQPPVDMAFLIDVSSSMEESLPAMKAAAREVTQELAAGKPGHFRFALIRFDSKAEINTSWIEDPEVLFGQLANLAPIAGGSDAREALVRLRDLMASARPEARKVAVFYTDGDLRYCDPSICPGGSMIESEIANETDDLRRSFGIDFFSIGVPIYGSDMMMLSVTQDPARILYPNDAGDLLNAFYFLADDVIVGLGKAGQLSHTLDGRHFNTPIEGTRWTRDPTGTLERAVPYLPQWPETYSHALDPQSMGLWKVGVAPPNLTFINREGNLETLQVPRRPYFLVLTWFSLFLIALPILLWAILNIRRREEEEEGVFVLPDVRRLPPPSRLPPLPDIVEHREPPIPTLFVGVGGAGRKALEAVRAELKEAHLGQRGQPYHFLYLDLDTKSGDLKTPFDNWPDYSLEEHIAPADIRRTQTYLPEPGQVPAHMAWFNASDYLDASREELNLHDGARGDRVLARMALFEWLKQENGPLAVLEQQCKVLADLTSKDETRQVVVLASQDGGVGSGWLIDIGRLIRRLTRSQQDDFHFVPEVIGVVCDSPGMARPVNQHALQTELESAMFSGGYPQRVTYQLGHAVLDAIDTETPFNWVFAVSARDDISVAAQCGDLAALLVERFPRSTLLAQADMLAGQEPILALTRSVHILPTLTYQKVQFELFFRLMGPNILLDLESTPDGSFAIREVSEREAEKFMTAWHNAESPGTPFRLLLGMALDQQPAADFLDLMGVSKAPGALWFAQTFITEVTKKLHGYRVPGTPEWKRGWMPGEAIATLRLLAQRLDQDAQQHLKQQGEFVEQSGGLSTAKAVVKRALINVEHMVKLARSVADELAAWMDDFATECSAVAQQRKAHEKLQQKLGSLEGRTYIDPEVSDDEIEKWAAEAFITWLGTSDTISGIRERLFFATTAYGDRAKIILRSFVGDKKDYTSAREAVADIWEKARLLASVVPVIRIEGALARKNDQDRDTLARFLSDIRIQSQHTLVVTPQMISADGASQTLDQFERLILQPPAQGIPRTAIGDDHAAVRRVALKGATPLIDRPSLPVETHVPFVSQAERTSELIRQRAAKKYNMEIPPFPSKLRIALAHPEDFRLFTHAYKAGHIGRIKDVAGIEQWVFLDQGIFLTFGEDQSLAAAAANYVWYVQKPLAPFPSKDEKGDFTPLQRWRDRGGVPDDHTLVLLAIDVYEV